MNRVYFAAFLAFCWFTVVSAEQTALVRFYPEDIDSSTVITINELFYESLQDFGFSSLKIVATDSLCENKECALAAAKVAGSEKVIYCRARILGSKWIVRGYHFNVGDGELLSKHSLDCRSIEDFEPVMKRLAEAIAKGKSVEDVAAIDNITQKEEDPTRFRRREGFYTFGIQVGYLYPFTDGSYNYWNDTWSDEDKRRGQYRQVLSTDIVNWFELPKNLSLQLDLHIGWGAEIGTHLILLKQFGRGDYSPYAGGGVGINYCFEGDPPDDVDEDKRNSGFTLIGKAGIQLLRTYNFRVHSDVGYKCVFNDDWDQGPYLNIGVTWRKSPRSDFAAARTRQNPLILALAGIGGCVSLLTILGVMLSASSY